MPTDFEPKELAQMPVAECKSCGTIVRTMLEMKQHKCPKTGDKATCQICNAQTNFNGKFWRHDDERTKHLAVVIQNRYNIS